MMLMMESEREGIGSFFLFNLCLSLIHHGVTLYWEKKLSTCRYFSSLCVFLLSPSCKAEGKSEMQPGSAQADAKCGPPVSGKPWAHCHQK